MSEATSLKKLLKIAEGNVYGKRLTFPFERKLALLDKSSSLTNIIQTLNAENIKFEEITGFIESHVVFNVNIKNVNQLKTFTEIYFSNLFSKARISAHHEDSKIHRRWVDVITRVPKACPHTAKTEIAIQNQRHQLAKLGVKV